MGEIAIMAPSLASQIAAGEVVERPASAVKELVENAIDADASRCDVEIEAGGIARLLVADDGSGMSAKDARLALERHATSKLGSLEELSRIETYGFRGEALPSIASVSRFVLRTRTRHEESGVEIAVEGGQEPSARPAGLPVGTTVEVRDLFYNVPARRKFLRSTGTESGHVTDVVEGAALAHPELTITLSRDGRKVREWLRASDREARVRTALHEELALCRGERGPLRVEALLSRPERARSGAGGLKLFVNARPVRERALAHTIAQAYGSVLERGRYPRGVVYLDLPSALVDVNVHPQKAEVRFADPRAVADAVYHVLSVELSKVFSLPTPPRSPWTAQRPSSRDAYVVRGGSTAPASGEKPWAPERSSPEPGPGETAAEPRVDEAIAQAGAPPEAGSSDADAASPIAPSPRTRWSSLNFLSQVRQTYFICESADGLYVIDQHAAAERVNFDRLRKQYRARNVSAQALLFPLTIAVRPVDAELVESRASDFLALGLDLRVRGSELLSVHSVPRLLQRASPERLVRDLLTEVARGGGRAFSDAVDLALATMACHGSIRAGDQLSADEARALLAALDRADFAGHCPHGRPIVAFTSWTELERKVGRR